MSDLISKKALIRDISKVCGDLGIELPDQVIDIITAQPTAYNVDAVVAELEEEREYSYADFEEYVNEKSPCLDAEYDDYFHRGLERAIKLVKRGGGND